MDGRNEKGKERKVEIPVGPILSVYLLMTVVLKLVLTSRHATINEERERTEDMLHLIFLHYFQLLMPRYSSCSITRVVNC